MEKMMTEKEHRLKLAHAYLLRASSLIYDAWAMAADPLDENDEELNKAMRQHWVENGRLLHEIMNRHIALEEARNNEEEEEDEDV